MTTIRDVAKHAGVSAITVSRVVNEAGNVNPETRARVKRAIYDLGYFPNFAARSLRSKQTYTIALILPDVTSAFWTTVARGVEDAAQGDGYSVFLCNTDENPDKFTKYINTVIRQRVDGVLVAPFGMDAEQLARLVEMKIPAVVIDRRVNGWEGDSVYCDSVAGAQALTQHLLSLGHERIAIISGPAATSTAEDRVTGYRLALKKAGIPIDERLILRGEFRESSGFTLTRELLENDHRPTAIIAANNAIAAGVLDGLRLQGKRVPGDIAVVCFDEMPEMERRFPFLTNVTQPAYDIGVNAAQLLLSRISDSGGLRPREVVLPTRLILRYSCGRFLQVEGPGSSVEYSLIPDQTESQLVKPLDDADRELLLSMTSSDEKVSLSAAQDSGCFKSNKERVVKALAFEKSDRLPILFGRDISRENIEAVIGRSLRFAPDGVNLQPEDLVEFAEKMGLDAVPCEVSWPLDKVDPAGDLVAKARQAYPPPSLAAQLSALENLLNAVNGTGVGVYVRFSSFLENAIRATGESDFHAALDKFPEMDKLMDMLAKHQGRVMRALCDRFGRDLLFVSIQDDALAAQDVVKDVDLFEGAVLPRLARMVNPAREHGLPIAVDVASPCASALPGLNEIGISVVQAASLEIALDADWAGELKDRFVLIGGVPPEKAVQGTKEEVEERVSQVCEFAKQQPGFIFSVTLDPFTHSVQAHQNFIALIRTAQRIGGFPA